MRETLQVINSLEAAGFFRRYAIGGAMGAIFYMEPIETEDLDILILLPANASLLPPLSPLYEELRRRGYQEGAEHVRIEGVPVQFLPVYNPLIEEAVAEAREFPYEDTPTRVPTAEHLLAIMLQTGRRKDRLRFEAFREQVTLDSVRLSSIIERHGLTERFRQWTTMP